MLILMTSSSFSELGISPDICRALADRGIISAFPIQKLVLPDALAGRDVLAKSRTGSGKTLAFAVPIVERLHHTDKQPSALILVPTRELASQVTKDFTEIAEAKHLRVASVYGGVDLVGQARRAVRADILVATPGRLEDLVSRKLLNITPVKILVLDEADRMLDMGFQPQVDRIVRRLKPDRQTMFFSATLDGAVGHLASAYTRNAVRHEIVSAVPTVDEVSHRFIPVSGGDKVSALVGLLNDEPGRVLVFVRTKRGAEHLVSRLRKAKVEAVAMHGDMTQSARERALADFEKGKARTLVATDVAARGLDVEDITHVINFDPPEDHTGYVHRVGRTARAGRTGVGITFVSGEQEGDVGRLAARLKLTTEFEEEGMKVSAPRVTYSSGGSRSMLRKRRRRL